MGAGPGGVQPPSELHISSASSTVLTCPPGLVCPPFSGSVLIEPFAPLAPGGPPNLDSTTEVSQSSVMSL